MTGTQHARPRTAAKAVMIIAIGFWLWFSIGSTASERFGPMNWLMHTLVPAGLFIVSTLLAWRWLGIGTALLTLERLLATAFVMRNFSRRTFSTSTFTPMSLSLAFPPLAAGILFLLCWRGTRLSEG